MSLIAKVMGEVTRINRTLRMGTIPQEVFNEQSQELYPRVQVRSSETTG
jgi:hypothetical protein